VTLFPRLVESFTAHRDSARAGDGEVHAGPVPVPRDPDSRAARPHPCGVAGLTGARRARACDVRPPRKLEEREYQYARAT
jgi:hypothetical protein